MPVQHPGKDTEESAVEVAEPIPPVSRWRRIGRGMVALIAVGGLLYVSGIYQNFFLHRTPADIEQPVLESKVNAPELVVPVIVHILAGPAGSERTETEARRLVANASNIWAQADVTFVLQEVRQVSVTTADLELFAAQPQAFIAQRGSYDPTAVNVYLARTLEGVNGLAYGGSQAVSVADYTSTLDFRTLAHEFGHLLGLGHVSSARRLMSSGATGTELTVAEIEQARELAERRYVQ